MNNCTNMHKRHQRNRSTVFSATAIKKGIVFELEGCSLASTCGTFSICMLRYCIAWKTCKHNLHILHVSPTVGRCWHIMAYVGWKTIGYCYVWHHCCVATGGKHFGISGISMQASSLHWVRMKKLSGVGDQNMACREVGNESYVLSSGEPCMTCLLILEHTYKRKLPFIQLPHTQNAPQLHLRQQSNVKNYRP